MNQGADLRHLYAPQAQAVSSRSTGLADVVQTGVIKSNVGKSVAAGASAANVDAARAGMAKETADMEAKYAGELEGLDSGTPPTKPLDLADVYGQDLGEAEYGAPTETGGVPTEAPGATPGSSPALISQGSPNAIANMVGKGVISHVAGTVATAATMNPVIGLAVSAITNMILGSLMKGDTSEAKHADVMNDIMNPQLGLADLYSTYGEAPGAGPNVAGPGEVASDSGPVTSSPNPQSENQNDPGETGPTPGAPGLGTSGSLGSVTGMSLAEAMDANSNDPGEGGGTGSTSGGSPGVADGDGGGGGGGGK